MRHNLVTKLAGIISFAGLLHTASAAAEDFDEGVTFGDWNRYILPDSGGRLTLGADQGPLWIYSGITETSPWDYTGGLHVAGAPIRFYLGAVSNTPAVSSGVFEIWNIGATNYPPTTDPLFALDSGAETAEFNGVDVSINSGTLTVGSSPVLTQTSSTSYLTGQGFLQTSGLSSALSGITPPTNTTWTNVYIPRGTVSNNAVAAFGTSIASGAGAFASGPNNTVASGVYSSAMGYLATASGPYSKAFGNNAVAEGLFSYAHGLQVTAKSASETVFGRFANMSSPINIGAISGLDGLLRLGNGTSTTDRSEAMTVLKSGQTTLTNKEWRAGSLATPAADPLANPASTTDSDGNALVVDGHALLNGKVTIAVPQGDISMGIYD